MLIVFCHGNKARSCGEGNPKQHSLPFFFWFFFSSFNSISMIFKNCLAPKSTKLGLIEEFLRSLKLLVHVLSMFAIFFSPKFKDILLRKKNNG